jgi:hypothetical protein
MTRVDKIPARQATRNWYVSYGTSNVFSRAMTFKEAKEEGRAECACVLSTKLKKLDPQLYEIAGKETFVRIGTSDGFNNRGIEVL